MDWTEVTPEEAAQNRYYGLRGWLLLFYAVAVIGFVANLAALSDISGIRTLYGERFGIVIALAVVQALLVLPFLILAPMKHPLMPKATLSALWLSVALGAVVALATDPAPMLTQVVVSAVFVGLFQWYLTRSKRVNVTYRHRVPPGGVSAPADG